MSGHRHTSRPTPVNQRNCFVNSALIGTLGTLSMGTGHLRGKAAEYLRLARNLSLHSPTRRHLIVMAERLERQAKEIEDAAAPGRQDEADNSESDDPEA